MTARRRARLGGARVADHRRRPTRSCAGALHSGPRRGRRPRAGRSPPPTAAGFTGAAAGIRTVEDEGLAFVLCVAVILSALSAPLRARAPRSAPGGARRALAAPCVARAGGVRADVRRAAEAMCARPLTDLVLHGRPRARRRAPRGHDLAAAAAASSPRRCVAPLRLRGAGPVPRGPGALDRWRTGRRSGGSGLLFNLLLCGFFADPDDLPAVAPRGARAAGGVEVLRALVARSFSGDPGGDLAIQRRRAAASYRWRRSRATRIAALLRLRPRRGARRPPRAVLFAGATALAAIQTRRGFWFGFESHG